MPGTKIPEAERREQILRATVAVATSVGLGGVTVRMVAAEAGVSIGLVLFHYATMERLREALLDWLLAHVLRLDLDCARARPGTAQDRLLALLGEELAAGDGLRPEIALLLEFWVQSGRQPAVRERLQRALAAYTAVFEALLSDALAPVAPPAGLAAAIVRSVLGLGLELHVTAEPPDLTPQLEAVRRLLDTMARPG
jgi:TetR/AcrR family transcriptional regulator, transcriptional repressor of bet genes